MPPAPHKLPQSFCNITQDREKPAERWLMGKRKRKKEILSATAVGAELKLPWRHWLTALT